MRLSLFTHDILLLFAGPLAWSVHFLLIYGATGVACARVPVQPQWLGVSAVGWGVLAAGLVTLAVLAATLRVRPRSEADHNRDFIRWVSTALVALAALAVVFETVGVFMLSGCATVT
jgi:hypothetical protein